METWMIYAIIASICVGLFWFAQKIKAEMPKLSDNGFILYTYITFIFAWGLGVFVFQESLLNQNIEVIQYAGWVMLFYTIVVKTRLMSLRYLSSSTYFINYRISSSLWLLIVGIFLFSENISFQEILWIIIWFVVFYLLIERKSIEESKGDVKKWFLYLLLGSFAIAWLQTLNKGFILLDLSVFSLVFYSGILGVFFVFLFKWGESTAKILKIHSKKQAVFFLLSWTIFSIATITNLLAYESWDLAIV